MDDEDEDANSDVDSRTGSVWSFKQLDNGKAVGTATLAMSRNKIWTGVPWLGMQIWFLVATLVISQSSCVSRILRCCFPFETISKPLIVSWLFCCLELIRNFGLIIGLM